MAEAQIPFPLGPPVAEEKKRGLFGGREAVARAPVETAAELSNLSRSTRTLEEKYNNIRSKLQSVDQNLLSTAKKNASDIKLVMSEMDDIKRELADFKEKMVLIIRELKLTAKAEDVKVLENYVNLWEPVNFVTVNTVEKIVRDVIREEK
jgi:seryl-tRNA synthetase